MVMKRLLRNGFRKFLLPVWVSISTLAAPAMAADESAEPAVNSAELKFFEERIRPVLIEHCYSCHSADATAVKGGLLLDSREGLMIGGDSGPALVAGQPEESLLLQAMRHESLEMPPSQKLSDKILGDFETWIRLGAADPRSGGLVAKKPAIDIARGREFWSFRPVVKPPVPAAGAWSQNEIDRFIIDAQQRHLDSLSDADSDRPNEFDRVGDVPADVLMRRLSFVLTGLPPSIDEQRAFAAAYTRDPEMAIASEVDRLLESPRYGERWGRHWLDVARYAESTGGGRSMMLPDAWRFRDYVIRSFNHDKPFDQLVREHLAGDLLPSSSDEQHDEQLTGVGYLMLGAINYEEQDKEQLRMDVVDEQIDSMGRSFLGMTLGCCRCHDHKFDPIPTADYYALAGIFRSTKSLTPGNVCGFVTTSLRTGYDKAAVAEWAAKDREFEIRLAQLKARSAPLSDRPDAPPVEQLSGILVDDTEAMFDGDWVASSYQQPFFGAGYRHCGQPRLGLSATYEVMLPADGEYVVRMVINHAESRSPRVPALITHADGESQVTVNQQIKPEGDGIFAELGRYHFDSTKVARVVIRASEASPGYVIVDAIQFVPVSLLSTGLPPATLIASPAATNSAGPAAGAGVAEMKQQLKTLEEERKLHAKAKPETPTVMCVEEEQQPGDWHIHIRGEIRNLGPKVSRGFITAATSESASAALSTAGAGTSGRRQLAEWVASADNPLTARVYVNRIWLHVMGEGLVRTPDNFGETGERPTHPELLDYLAATFMEDGWSTKKLIRRICLSRAFRQSSAAAESTVRLDPGNRFLKRAFRRRLDAESVRDSLLQISGALDLNTVSGRTIAKLSTYDNEYRHAMHPTHARSVFVPSFRNTMLDLFEIFDGANPNLVSGKRTHSTRPAQALYLLNSPFVMTQARLAAEAFLASARFRPQDGTENIQTVWRLCVGRPPTSEESEAALQVVGADLSSKEAWTEVFHALFASLDFRYLE
jgi:hypothetical protein